MKNNQTIDKKAVGRRIKEIRLNLSEKKLTQTEFAELIDRKLRKSSVMNWEKGDNLPNKERLNKIAELGNVSLPYLYFGITEENKIEKIIEVEKVVEVEKVIEPKMILKEETILNNEAIGKRIKEIRLNTFEEKITLEKFGKMLEPSAIRPLVSKWEKGLNLPNKERLKQIAEIGNVSIEYLYFGINAKKATEIIKEIENNPVSDVGYFITQEQINELKKSFNYIE